MRIEAARLTKEFAGKSTTLQLMLGLVRGGGRTLFDGRPYQELPCPVREVGAVLDANAFHPRRSARDHLRMLAAAGHSPGGTRGHVPDRRVDQALDLGPARPLSTVIFPLCVAAVLAAAAVVFARRDATSS